MLSRIMLHHRMSSFPKVNARKIPNRHAQHHLTRTQKHVQTCFIQLNTLFYEARLVLNDFFERLEMLIAQIKGPSQESQRLLAISFLKIL